MLATHNIWTVADVHDAALQGRLADVEADWVKVPGQGYGVSWGYFLILARPQRDDGDDGEGAGPAGLGLTPDLLTQYADAVVGVKPDRMIIRYVAAALGIDDERAFAPILAPRFNSIVFGHTNRK